MKRRERRAPFSALLLTAVVWAGAQLSLHAALLVADGGTTNRTTGINLSPADLVVGTNGGNTTVNILGPGGAVTNASGYIGFNASSTSNRVTVRNANAVWRNTGDLHIGTNSAFNSLVISNGGSVSSANALLGYTASGSNNQVTVIGPGSVWNGGNLLYVGVIGSFNTLLITNGGVVTNVGAVIANDAASSHNQGTVTGTNSAWNQSGNLSVGEFGSFNTLLIANGAHVTNQSGLVGNFVNAGNNQAIVTGANSRWNNNGELRVGNEGSGNRLVVSAGGAVASSGILRVGNFGSGNQLVISNGVVVASGVSSLGVFNSSSNNQAVVTGAGSLWTNATDLQVGDSGNGNQLVVSNGAVVADRLFVGRSGSGNRLIVSAGGTMVAKSGSFLGVFNSSSNNQAVVTGAGSLWTNATFLSVGIEGNGSQLVVSNAGTVTAATLTVGIVSSSFNNRVTVDGGTLRVSGTFEIRRGTNVLNAGLIDCGTLLVSSSSASQFEFNGGTLAATNSGVNSGVPFLVGNGVSAATNQLQGNGFHTFYQGLILTNNARLTGNGTIAGTLTVRSGGSVAPGNSIGQLILSASPALNGALLMEISKPDVSTFTNDQLEVSATLTYGGALTLTHLGPKALAAGDVASLFNATSYDGAFTSVSLPALDSGLMWTNRLLVNGSLAVVTHTPPSLSGVTQSGTNLLFNVTGGSPGGAFTVLTSTNVALPRSSWTTNSTGNFDWLGNVTVTNGINASTPQSFFTLRVP